MRRCAHVQGAALEQSWQPLAFFATSSFGHVHSELIPIRPKAPTPTAQESIRFSGVVPGRSIPGSQHRGIDSGNAPAAKGLLFRRSSGQAARLRMGVRDFFCGSMPLRIFWIVAISPKLVRRWPRRSPSIANRLSISLPNCILPLSSGDAFLRRDAAGARQWWSAWRPGILLISAWTTIWPERAALDRGPHRRCARSMDERECSGSALPAIGSCEFDRHRYSCCVPFWMSLPPTGPKD